MKIFNYILLIGLVALSFTACHEDSDVVITKLSVTASAEPSYTSARITCKTNLPGPSVSYIALQYSKSEDFSNVSTKKGMGKVGSEYVLNIYNLDPNTKYYVRFIVENTVTSKVVNQVYSFTTLQTQKPTLGNVSVEDVSSQSATFKCQIAHNGGNEVYENGFYYKKSSSSSWTLFRVGSTTSLFSATITLDPATSYDVYAYAKNNVGEQQTSIVSFTTHEYITIPSVTTAAASNIGISSVTLGGIVTSDGGDAVTEYGVCYTSSSSSPTITSGTCVVMGAGTGSFSQTVEDLQPNTTYRVRAYAKNNKGVAYGSTIYVTTNALPDVVTYTPTSITASSASVTGYTSDACDLRGICYSHAATPTINDYVIERGSGSGSYSTTLSSLQAGTTYYARAFAYFGSEVIYGNTIQFTTLTVNPVVQTTNVEGVSSTSATVNAAVTSDGGQTIIERGVCYSTSTTPTVANAKVSSGVGVGSYSCQLTGLSSSTTYYVRAYAATASGVVYGSQLTFTTN